MISIFDIHKKLGLNQENGLFIRNEISVYPNSIWASTEVKGRNIIKRKSNTRIEFKKEV